MNETLIYIIKFVGLLWTCLSRLLSSCVSIFHDRALLVIHHVEAFFSLPDKKKCLNSFESLRQISQITYENSYDEL